MLARPHTVTVEAEAYAHMAETHQYDLRVDSSYSWHIFVSSHLNLIFENV